MARLAAYEDYRRQMHLRWLHLARAQAEEVTGALRGYGLILSGSELAAELVKSCDSLRGQVSGDSCHAERFSDTVRARMMLVNLTEWIMMWPEIDLDAAAGALVQEMDRSYTSTPPVQALALIQTTESGEQMFAPLACLARAAQYDVESLLRMYFGKCMLCGTISRRVHRSVYHPGMWTDWEQEFLELSSASRHCSLHEDPAEFARCMSQSMKVAAGTTD